MNTEEKELEITVQEFKKLVPNCCPYCVEGLFDDLVMLPIVYEGAKLEDIVQHFKKEYSKIQLVSEYMGTTVYHNPDGEDVIEVDYDSPACHRWICASCGEEIEDYKPENQQK